MVLYTLPVACYIPVFPPSFHPRVDQPTVTSLVTVIGHDVAPAGHTLVINNVHKTREETCLVFTTDEDNTDIFETNTAQEEDTLVHVRIPILILPPRTLQLIQAHCQVFALSFPLFSPSSFILVFAAVNFKLYYQVKTKYWLWKRRHRRQWPVCPSDLDAW